MFIVCTYIISYIRASLVISPIVPFLLIIVLSVHRFTESDYKFGILKLFSRTSFKERLFDLKLEGSK